MGFKVLIPQDVANDGKQYLLERGYEIKMGTGITPEILKKEIEDCDAVLLRTAFITEDVIKTAKKLKVIAKHGIGVDNVDIKAATANGIYVTFAPLSNAGTVAEHCIGLIIALARNIVRLDKEFRNGNFDLRTKLLGIDLAGKTLGVVGLGRIGSMVAQKAARGLDMKVIGYDPFVKQEKVISEVELTRDWQYVFKNADFISLHLPSTESTRRIVGKKEFAMMKPTAYFVNASRGEVVDENALIEALQQNKIAGAGLDVFEQEPLGDNHAFFSMQNVILTPHNAALTAEATVRMSLHAAIGIDEVLSGKEPSWPVNNPFNIVR